MYRCIGHRSSRGLHTWQIGAAIGVGGAAIFGNVLYFGQKQSIEKLIRSSITALKRGSSKEREDNEGHWDLLKHCLRKKAYGADILAQVGGVDLLIESIRVEEKKNGRAQEDEKIRRRVRGPIELLPYFCLNASPKVLRQFVESGGVELLRPVVLDERFRASEKYPALQTICQLQKKGTDVEDLLHAGVVELMHVARSPDEWDFCLTIVRDRCDTADDLVSRGVIEPMVRSLKTGNFDDGTRVKVGDTLGLLSATSEGARTRIAESGATDLVEGLSMKY
eukprot:g3282.t1